MTATDGNTTRRVEVDTAPPTVGALLRGSGYGRAAAADEIADVEAAPQGFRHRTVFAAAAACGELLAGGELADADGVRALLVQAGRAAIPDDASGVDRAVRNGLERGRRQPRQAPEGGGPSSRGEAVALVAAWWEAVQDDGWRDAKAATTLRILGAFALLAIGAGKIEVSESYRQIAEAAGVSVGTVAKHRGRWLRWVRVVTAGSRISGEPTVWRLRASGNTPRSPRGSASGAVSRRARLPQPARDPLDDPSHDRWYRWPNGWRLYLLLDADEPATAGELAEATGLHPATVRRALACFRRWRVAEPDGDGGWRLTGVCVGNPGRRRAQRAERHRIDRELWRGWRHGRLRRGERTVDPLPAGVDAATGEIVDEQREAA